MADGGACSSDPFRLPGVDDELAYPFGNGLVVRYGHTARLVANTVAVAGVTADFPPPTEDPYRLLYFVVADHVGTVISVLRTSLKEGLTAPGRPLQALSIDILHTLEVYRKQGLATSLINFVKGIAEAHGIGLYARCELFTRTFWELRDFQEETLFEVTSVCNRLDEFTGLAVLLRAGRGYSEYQPGNEERLSNIRPFNHTQYGDVHMTSSGSRPHPTTSRTIGGIHCKNIKNNSDGIAATNIFSEAPSILPGFSMTGSARAGGAAGVCHNGDGEAAVARVQGDSGNGNTVVFGGGGGAGPMLTDARLARHDEQEEAKRASCGSGGGISATGIVVGSAAAAAATAAAVAAAVHDRRRLPGSAQLHSSATTGGHWPGSSIAPDFIGSGGGGGGREEASTVGAAGSLGWPPPNDNQPGVAALAALAATDPATITRENMAARALTALPISRQRGAEQDEGMRMAPSPYSVVDLTGGEAGRSLAEREDEEMQMAIALSLSAVACGVGDEGGSGSGGWSGVGGAGEGDDGHEDGEGDDTETDEDPGYGGGGQLLGGDKGGGSCEAGSKKMASVVAARATPHTDNAMNTAAACGIATAAATEYPRVLQEVNCIIGRQRHRGKGDRGDSGSENSSGGGGRGRRAEDAGRYRQENDSRRLRRRRDKSGASTPGEQSPNGADGGDTLRTGQDELDRDSRSGSSCGSGSGTGSRATGIEQLSGIGTLGSADGRCHGFIARHPGADLIGGTTGNATPSFAPVVDSTAVDTTKPLCSRTGMEVDVSDLGGGGDGKKYKGSEWRGSSGNGSTSSSTCDSLNTNTAVAGNEKGEKMISSCIGNAWTASSCPSFPPGNKSSSSLLSPSSRSPREEEGGKSLTGGGGGGTGGQKGAMMGAGAFEDQHHDQNETQRVYVPQARGLSQQRQRDLQQQQQQQQQQRGGMVGGLGAMDVIGPPPAVPGVETGAGDMGGGGFMHDLENDELWREMGVDPGGASGVGAGGGGVGGGGGGSLDTLLAAASWEREDADEDLMRALEASKRSHEEEMLRRATEESREAAVTAAAYATTQMASLGADRLPPPLPPPRLLPSPSPPSPSLETFLRHNTGIINGGAIFNSDGIKIKNTTTYAATATASTVAAAIAASSGGGPDTAVLPPPPTLPLPPNFSAARVDEAAAVTPGPHTGSDQNPAAPTSAFHIGATSASLVASARQQTGNPLSSSSSSSYQSGGGGGSGGLGVSTGWQVVGGLAAGLGSVEGAGGATAVDSATWPYGWDDGGEVVGGFVGKGKGRCRDRV